MRIQLKILDKEFYIKNELLLCDPPKKVYQNLSTYQTPGSAAIDLVCTKDVNIYPGEKVMISTGIAIWIGSASASPGTINSSPIFNFHTRERLRVAGMIFPRSGLGTEGLVLANTVGVIDEDYQGELMVSAWNSNVRDEYYDDYDSEENWCEYRTVNLKAGDRFAQLLFLPVIKATFDIVEEFSNKTSRIGGFGSTGAV